MSTRKSFCGGLGIITLFMILWHVAWLSTQLRRHVTAEGPKSGKPQRHHQPIDALTTLLSKRPCKILLGGTPRLHNHGMVCSGLTTQVPPQLKTSEELPATSTHEIQPRNFSIFSCLWRLHHRSCTDSATIEDLSSLTRPAHSRRSLMRASSAVPGAERDLQGPSSIASRKGIHYV